MKYKKTDDPLERVIKDSLAQNVPEPELPDKKMEDVYQKIRNMQPVRKRKLPTGVKFGTAAAVLALIMVYSVKNPAVAAQIPLIGTIFQRLEGDVSFPGDYSNKSIRLGGESDRKDDGTKTEQTEIEPETEIQNETENDTDTIRPERTDNTIAGTQTDDNADDEKSKTQSYQEKVDGVTVTLSEVAYDHNAIYLAILVQNEDGFVKDALYPDILFYDAQVKLYRPDGSTKEFDYKSEGIFLKGIEGEYTDSNTFKGIFQFMENGTDLSDYTACDLTFRNFQQQLTTGETETIVVPDYGEVPRTIYDSEYYKGPWKFRLDFDGVAISEQEAVVHDTNEQGFGIEKVVKTEFEIYAVPILPEGEKGYNYVATIWDADGEALETRNYGDYLTMSHYGRDVSEVTVYLLRAEDFLDNKGENSYLQPEKAIYTTTVRFNK